jgi:hypothetical protein
MPNKKKINLQDQAEKANLILSEKIYKSKNDTVTSNTPGAVIDGGKKEKNKNSKNLKKNAKKQKN